MLIFKEFIFFLLLRFLVGIAFLNCILWLVWPFNVMFCLVPSKNEKSDVQITRTRKGLFKRIQSHHCWNLFGIVNSSILKFLGNIFVIPRLIKIFEPIYYLIKKLTTIECFDNLLFSNKIFFIWKVSLNVVKVFSYFFMGLKFIVIIQCKLYNLWIASPLCSLRVWLAMISWVKLFKNEPSKFVGDSL